MPTAELANHDARAELAELRLAVLLRLAVGADGADSPRPREPETPMGRALARLRSDVLSGVLRGAAVADVAALSTACANAAGDALPDDAGLSRALADHRRRVVADADAEHAETARIGGWLRQAEAVRAWDGVRAELRQLAANSGRRGRWTVLAGECRSRKSALLQRAAGSSAGGVVGLWNRLLGSETEPLQDAAALLERCAAALTEAAAVAPTEGGAVPADRLDALDRAVADPDADWNWVRRAVVVLGEVGLRPPANAAELEPLPSGFLTAAGRVLGTADAESWRPLRARLRLLLGLARLASVHRRPDAADRLLREATGRWLAATGQAELLGRALRELARGADSSGGAADSARPSAAQAAEALAAAVGRLPALEPTLRGTIAELLSASRQADLVGRWSHATPPGTLALSVLDGLAETEPSTESAAELEAALLAVRGWLSGFGGEVRPRAWSWARAIRLDELAADEPTVARFHPTVPMGVVYRVRQFGLSELASAAVAGPARECETLVSAGPSPVGFAELFDAVRSPTDAGAESLKTQLRGWPSARLDGSWETAAVRFHQDFWGPAGAGLRLADAAAFQRLADGLARLLEAELGLRSFRPERYTDHANGWVENVSGAGGVTGRVARVLRPGLSDRTGSVLLLPAVVELE